MSNDIDTRPHADRTTETGADSQSRPSLEHITVENDGEPDECALFPCEATETELHTTWITAQEGSFTDLESMR